MSAPSIELKKITAASTRAWWDKAPRSDLRERRIGRHLLQAHCSNGYDPARPNAFLVHGMADSGDTWAPVLDALNGYNTWLFDLPWSGRDGSDWPLTLLAEQWWEVAMELVEVRPSLLIGHSFGATLLLDRAVAGGLKMPVQLILLSPFCLGRRDVVDWNDLDAFARGVRPRFKAALRVRFGNNAPADPVVDSMAEKLEQRVLPEPILELFRIYLRSRNWLLASTRQRCDVIYGDSDGPVASRSAEALAAGLPDVRCHRIARCGHYSMHEQPGELSRLIEQAITPALMEACSI